MCLYVYLSGDTYGRLNVLRSCDLCPHSITTPHKCQGPQVFPNPHTLPQKVSGPHINIHQDVDNISQVS